MSVLVFIDTPDGKIFKSAYEGVYYAKQLNEGDVVCITYGKASDTDLAGLGKYGASRVARASALTQPDDLQLVRLMEQAAEKFGAKTVVFLFDARGKAVAPMLSARLKAGLIPGATALPENGKEVRKNVFSGKAFAFMEVKTEKKIISLLPNSLKPLADGSECPVEEFSGDFGSAAIRIVETKRESGGIALPEAEKVVSAGRGLKGPENWGIVEELASELGAATACSRPVADIGWRPHHEHVGQTGVAIRPNLYIAVGISGAIQHLAGVNGSKTIVVINNDPEAPFFKAADYGVLGDAFEIVPRLTEAVRKFKANN